MRGAKRRSNPSLPVPRDGLLRCARNDGESHPHHGLAVDLAGARLRQLADDVVFGSSGDLAVDLVANDPDNPIKGLPSIRFDLKLARESAADNVSGRVGSDPAAIVRPAATAAG